MANKPSVIDINKPYELPIDISSVKLVKQYTSDGTEFVYNRERNYDIYNNYELSSNERAVSEVTPESKEIPHPEDVDFRHIFYKELSIPLAGNNENFFQIVTFAGGETYLSLKIGKKITKVEFYDSTEKVGFFEINRRDYPLKNEVQFYLRAHQVEVRDGLHTSQDIDLRTIITDDSVDYIGGTSVGVDIPTTSQFHEAQYTNQGIFKLSPTKIETPSRDMSFMTVKKECRRLKELFYANKFIEGYQTALVYDPGDEVVYKGSRYVALARNVNRNPLESLLWKKN